VEDNNKATIVLLSGDMDKVFAALTIATGCAAAGMDTAMFFTFWGLNAVKNGNGTGEGVMGKMIGAMLPKNIDGLNPSKFSFGGMGRVMFGKMMGDKGVASLSELRQMCIDLGVRFWACKTSMDVMEIDREDLIPEVEDIVGVAKMVAQAADSKIQLFI
jgi:peroxiredoxin family protein